MVFFRIMRSDSGFQVNSLIWLEDSGRCWCSVDGSPSVVKTTGSLHRLIERSEPPLKRSVSAQRRLRKGNSMHRTLLCIVLPLAVVLSACSVVPNAPANKPPVNPPEIDLSTLDLKVLVPYSVIAHELNRAIENELYWVSGQQFDCPVTECSFQVRVLRAGDISVRPDNSGQLVLSMPIRTSDGRIDAAQDLLFGKKAKAKADLTATITATATIDFELNPDWSSKPNVSLAFQVRRAGAHVLQFPLLVAYIFLLKVICADY